MGTIAFHTLGCKLNFAESSDLMRRFGEKGYVQVDFRQKADVYVINTCTVTQTAEKKCRNAIRQAHRVNPDAIVAVIGCFSQVKAEDIEKIEGVNIILGNDNKHKLLEYVLNSTDNNGKENHVEDISRQKDFHISYSSDDRTRSFLKVQDGCDYFCSYCEIPFARGRNRSAGIDEICNCARQLAREGKKEIVLTGVNIGEYGSERGETFLQLIRSLDEIKEINRYRISSIEPNLISERIIDFCGSSRSFLPHFHIPLQAGTDKILALMKRKYTRELFANRVEYIKNSMPHAFIAADVIVGFPQETDEDFASARDFIASLPLSALHVFTYSERPGTVAARMHGKVPFSKRKERSLELQRLSERKKEEFCMNNMGTEREILWEADCDKGLMYGFTDNYIRVGRKFDARYINTITKERLETYDRENKHYIIN